jgi:hypothetical protein
LKKYLNLFSKSPKVLEIGADMQLRQREIDFIFALASLSKDKNDV